MESQWGEPIIPNPAIEAATSPRPEIDYSGVSLRINGESFAETISREFGVKPDNPIAVQAAMRAEKDTVRKAQLSGLYSLWQEQTAERTADEE
jgi:hypothetical protein